MLVQYVDDCGIAAPNQAHIDRFVQDLKDMGFELTQEGSFAQFLGSLYKDTGPTSLLVVSPLLICFDFLPSSHTQ